MHEEYIIKNSKKKVPLYGLCRFLFKRYGKYRITNIKIKYYKFTKITISTFTTCCRFFILKNMIKIIMVIWIRDKLLK